MTSNNPKKIKTSRKKIGKRLSIVLLILLFSSIALSIPAIQTKIANLVTSKINSQYGIDIQIEHIDLSVLGSVSLKNIQIKDHHQDTLIYIKSLKTSFISFQKALNSKLLLDPVYLEGTYYYIKTYKGEKADSFSIFYDSILQKNTSKKATSIPFILKTDAIHLSDFNIRISNKNVSKPVSFSATNTYGVLQNFDLSGPNVSANIRNLTFTDNRNIHIKNLSTDYAYTPTSMDFKNTLLVSENSFLKAEIRFQYDKKDLANFNQKVFIRANFKESELSTIDLHHFYKELQGNKTFDFSGNMSGTINAFRFQNLKLSNNALRFFGDIKVSNTIEKEKGVVFESDIETLTASYLALKELMPKLVNTYVTEDLDRLGTISINGITKITQQNMDAFVTVNTDLGNILTDLQLTNINDKKQINYRGEVEFLNFDLGTYTQQPALGRSSFKGTIYGSSLEKRSINAAFIASVSSLKYKKYAYKNIELNGQYKNNILTGDVSINDAYFRMNLDGVADFSKRVHAFNFNADIINLNLQKTKLFTRDSISVLEGILEVDYQGNSLDDAIGTAIFKNVLYVNQKKAYSFKKFTIRSSAKNAIKTIAINSKDIINGSLKGRFLYNELALISQNALGSMYANYTPYKVSKNQFIDFNFSIYNKIIDLFYPNISVSKNTKIKGKINAKNNSLKVLVDAPKITLFKNELENVKLRMDNKNKLYNTHLTASKIKTEYYTISKLNLLNRTQNDTLFFKSVFNGNDLKNERFNVDFFYTINKDKKSVLGFQKSTVGVKNNIWKINPKDNKNNKVTFNLKDGEYVFSPFRFESESQTINFNGYLKGASEKKLSADFSNVKLQEILPKIDSLEIRGALNGTLDFVEKNNLYSPEGTLLIENFEINNFKQGNLALNVVGNNSYQKYDVGLSLEREYVKSIGATGSLDFSLSRPNIDLEVFLEEFELNAFSPLGQDVLSKIRGKASGAFTLKGFIGNPEMEGNLKLENAGLQFPYLNTDYDFQGISSIALQNQSFIFEDINLLDTKYNTTGVLNGSITHQNFDDWFLNINILAKNLAILDTQDSEEALYYGKGFIKGDVLISGLTDQLTIDINAKTQPNTLFVLPLKDIQTIDNYKLIHFKTEQKANQQEIALEALKGLALNINLEVTKDAVAEVVIDEINGSKLKGSGSGNLRVEIDTRGKFNMFGDFLIDNGVYDFKYGGVINKPFSIQKGGTVSWNGNPIDASLNVTAIYETKANPAVLLDNFNTNRQIPIHLITKISGGLFTSSQEFDIKIPNLNSNIESELNFILNDNNINQKTTQFISLLALGSFVNPLKTSIDGNSAITNTASSAIASAVSNLINDADSKFQFGVDYTQASENDVENLNTDSQLDVSISTNISNKVIINGKVGVPVGEKTQSSVVGEVKLEVLLNEQGSFRGVVFNRQNEIQYSTQEEGYTQGLGLSYQVNFNSLAELIKKINLKQKEFFTKKVDSTSLKTSKEMDFKKRN